MGSKQRLHQIKDGPPLHFTNDIRAYQVGYAKALDEQDPLRHLRDQFIIPTKADLERKTLASQDDDNDEDTKPCIYLCGNSLGLQPCQTANYIQTYLQAWASKGVQGHLCALPGSTFPPWLQADEVAAKEVAGIVGALPSEVAVMQTLTANLHLLMASFYRPTKERWKVIIEGKAFPSDHYAVESQIRHHNFVPSESIITIEPDDDTHGPTLTTKHILSVIDFHAATTALILLPGIQYYTGQYLDMAGITAHAHSHGIIIGWDLAHAVGNVDVRLHEWDVDFAVWCHYKYVNAGPGAIAGMFVHERHGGVDGDAEHDHDDIRYRPRLTGWWGSNKASRFQMSNEFVPIPGAAGYQLSNPCIISIASLLSSLQIFSQTDMASIRQKSRLLTGYLEHLLTHYPISSSSPEDKDDPRKHYQIITPSDPLQRGAQLSIKLHDPAHLKYIMHFLEENGVVVDERKPDVVRVAPAPLYSTFEDVWRFVELWREGVQRAVGIAAGVDAGAAGAPDNDHDDNEKEEEKEEKKENKSIMLDGAKKAKGWGEIV